MFKNWLADRLEFLMDENNLNQAEFAGLVGISPNTIVKIKKGASPNIDTVKKIAETFNISIDWLVGNSPLDEYMKGIKIMGVIPAGPLERVWPEPEGFISLPGYLLKPVGVNYFGVRIIGESMINAGLLPGTIAVFAEVETAGNGNIVAVLWDGEMTVKKYYKYKNHIVLQPANPLYHPTIIPGKDAGGLRIRGRLIIAVTYYGEMGTEVPYRINGKTTLPVRGKL